MDVVAKSQFHSSLESFNEILGNSSRSPSPGGGQREENQPQSPNKTHTKDKKIPSFVNDKSNKENYKTNIKIQTMPVQNHNTNSNTYDDTLNKQETNNNHKNNLCSANIPVSNGK